MVRTARPGGVVEDVAAADVTGYDMRLTDRQTECTPPEGRRLSCRRGSYVCRK
jgi:hypothetical protein